MKYFEENPKLGHITTFGGNPVIAASCLANLRELRDSKIIDQIESKEELFRKELNHKKINNIRGKGLMLAPVLENTKMVNKLVIRCLEKGVLLFWLLWENKAVRISPPLNIKKKDIKKGCKIIREVLENI